MKNLLFALAILTFSQQLFAQDGKQELSDFHLDKEYKINKKGTIDLSCSDANVYITGSTRDKVHVKIDRIINVKGWSSIAEFTVDITERDGDLQIRERQRGSDVSVGYFHEEYKIQIEAPEETSLLVRGDDGDYYIKNINGNISLSLDDADAELVSCKGEKFDFRFDDGDLRMDQAKGAMQIDGDDSDIEIYNAKLTSLEASVDDGELTVESTLVDNGRYDLEAQDGMIFFTVTNGGGEFEVSHDDGSVRTEGGFERLYESEDRTKLRLAGGNARIVIRGDDARVRLARK